MSLQSLVFNINTARNNTTSYRSDAVEAAIVNVVNPKIQTASVLQLQLVNIDMKQVDLTPKEWGILSSLYVAKGYIVSGTTNQVMTISWA